MPSTFQVERCPNKGPKFVSCVERCVVVLQHLNRQVEALDKLTKLTDSIKERANEPADRRLRYLQTRVHSV